MLESLIWKQNASQNILYTLLSLLLSRKKSPQCLKWRWSVSIATQMDRANQDISGESCLRNHAGELAILDNDKLKAWFENYARLLNVEIDWPSKKLPKTASIAGQPPEVSREMICMALSKMKCGKAAGPSGIVAEMLKATKDLGVELMRQISDAVFKKCGVSPTDWEESYILNLHKGKGEALNRGNYRGLKLTDQVGRTSARIRALIFTVSYKKDPMLLTCLSTVLSWVSRKLLTLYPSRYCGEPFEVSV